MSSNCTDDARVKLALLFFFTLSAISLNKIRRKNYSLIFSNLLKTNNSFVFQKVCCLNVYTFLYRILLSNEYSYISQACNITMFV